MKTSLGIWAFGSMATRFNPGGYKPELVGVSTAAKVRTAVEGLGDLVDDYEFHYPQELREDNLAEVREALAGHGIYCVASGLHLDPRFGKGGFSSPDDTIRGEALRLTREAIDLAGNFAGVFEFCVASINETEAERLGGAGRSDEVGELRVVSEIKADDINWKADKFFVEQRWIMEINIQRQLRAAPFCGRFVARCNELCHGLFENLPILWIFNDRGLIDLNH